MTARPAQSLAFGTIWQILHFNPIMLSPQFMQIWPGFPGPVGDRHPFDRRPAARSPAWAGTRSGNPGRGPTEIGPAWPGSELVILRGMNGLL